MVIAIADYEGSCVWKVNFRVLGKAFNEKQERYAPKSRRIIMQICSGSGFSRTVECLSVSRCETRYYHFRVRAAFLHCLLRERENKENSSG